MNTTQKPPRGCENSSSADSSRTVLSMSDLLPKSLQGTCADILSVISSLASADGPLPSNSPDGLRQSLLELAPAPASHSAQPVKDSRKKTRDTYGRSSLPSSAIVGTSASHGLSQSLANKLQTRLGTDGSTEYRQTWKQKVTPAGRPYWAHIPSQRPINDKDCTGWPTPNCNTNDQPDHTKRGQETLLGLRESKNSPKVTGWSSPTVGDANSARNSTATRYRIPPTGIHAGNTLTDLADICGLQAMSHAEMVEQGLRVPSQDGERWEDVGATFSSSTAETEKPAAFQLNPHFSRWLQGFPPEWCDCAVTAMQSFPSVRKPSSKHTVKP